MILEDDVVGDMQVFGKVKKYFNPITRETRRAVKVHDNRDGQLGPSRKERKGRMLGDMKEAQACCKEMVATVMTNVVDPFMKKVLEEEVDLSWGMLVEDGKDAGEKTDDKHRDTPAVREAARRLVEVEKVTCREISLLTKAMFLIDCITSAAIRK